MDIVPAEPVGPQDTDIKREASYGNDVDTKMADIPESAGDGPNDPRSSQPTSTAGSVVGEGQSKLSAAQRAAKKKGTAALVKKTSSRKGTGGGNTRGGRSRGGAKSRGSSSRGGGGGKKSSASTYNASGAGASSPTSAMGGTASHTAGSSEVGGSDEESDHGPYCICRGPDDHRWMIGCDVCEDWFHGECVDIDKAIGDTLIQRYVCPACTAASEGVNVTRYKKTCSLEGCLNPARIYDDMGGLRQASYSVFCSDRHAEEWWEQLVRSLPESGKLKAKEADLTREKFMGLLNVTTVNKSVEGEEPWYIGKKPFAVPSEFWSKVDHTLVLTPEEQSFLSASAADRYALAEEIVLNKKMQQLLDLANERRKAAITSGLFDKDTCGYDARLDLVGCPVEFALFVKSAQGEVIYKGDSLSAEGSWTEEQMAQMRQRAEEGDDGKEFNPATAGMCDRRRCKPHAGWYNIFTKSTRHLIKELARQAKEKLDAETRVREAAATRYFRRRHDRASVTRLDGTVTT